MLGRGHQRTARDCHRLAGGPAVHPPSVPGAVVGAVEVRGAQRAPDGGIEHDHVGVAARGERAFPRVEAEHLRRVRRGDGDE